MHDECRGAHVRPDGCAGQLARDHQGRTWAPPVLLKLAEVRATLIKSITVDRDGVAGRNAPWIKHGRLLNERGGLAA